MVTVSARVLFSDFVVGQGSHSWRRDAVNYFEAMHLDAAAVPEEKQAVGCGAGFSGLYRPDLRMITAHEHQLNE
ncbi:hypothetical protein ACRS6B_24440 [Nocardia asteroides]